MGEAHGPSDAEIDEANRRTEFVRDAMPDSWLSYAEELGEAAAALWSHTEDDLSVQATDQVDGPPAVRKCSPHARTYLLIAGLALENCLKGLAVVRNPTLVREGKICKALKTHNLLKLAEMTEELRLTESDRHVLQVCQDAIPYWGRYPVPLHFGDLEPAQAATESFRRAFEDLHYRLCRRIYDAIKDGWDSGAGAAVHRLRSRRYGDRVDLSEPLLPPRGKNDQYGNGGALRGSGGENA
jgi:hypothetical protein